MDGKNLWVEAWTEFWRDPKRVIPFFLSEGFMRRAWAVAWLVTVLFVLIMIVLPTQQRSWALWLPEADRQLAYNTAAGVTFVSFFVVGMVQVAWNMKNYVVAGIGIVVAALFLVFALFGAFNYYAYGNAVTSGVSRTANTGASDAVAEAEKALATHNTRLDDNLKMLDQAIAAVPSNYPTGKSRLVAQRVATASDGQTERARLETALAEARASQVVVVQTKADTRPIDGVLSGLVQVERVHVANVLDALRSSAFEMVIIIGAPLAAISITAQFAGAVTVVVPPPSETAPPLKGEKPLPRRRTNQPKLRKPTPEEIEAWERELAGLPDPETIIPPAEEMTPEQASEPPVEEPPVEEDIPVEQPQEKAVA